MDGETYLALITATFLVVVFLALFGDKLCEFLDWSLEKLAEWLSSRSRR